MFQGNRWASSLPFVSFFRAHCKPLTRWLAAPATAAGGGQGVIRGGTSGTGGAASVCLRAEGGCETIRAGDGAAFQRSAALLLSGGGGGGDFRGKDGRVRPYADADK